MLTIECLRKALGDKLGCVLTPELATEILMASIDSSEHAFDPQAFAPRRYRDLVFQAESFRDILPELEPLHAAQFAETERHLAGFELAPDYAYMAERERMGTLIQFTARDAAGTLVGNLRVYLAVSRHTGHLVAAEDTFYLVPAARRGRNAVELLIYAIAMLRSVAQVREIRVDSKVVNRAHRLMDYLGFDHVANQYIKLFAKD